MKIGGTSNTGTNPTGLNGRSPLVSRPESGTTGNFESTISANPFGRAPIRPTLGTNPKPDAKKDTTIEDIKFTGGEKLKPNVDFSTLNATEAKKPATKPKNTLQDWYDAPISTSNKPDLNKPKLTESLGQSGNTQSKAPMSKKDDFFDSGPDYGQSEKFKPSFLQGSRKFTPGPNAFVKRDPQIDLMSSVDVQPANVSTAAVTEEKYEVEDS